MPPSAKRLGALAASSLALALGACGERTLSAEEFVDAVRDQGVELELGERLISGDPEKELYAIELEPLHGVERSAGGHAHTGGTLAVYDEVEQAREGVEQCQAAADLVCYRAANVVVILAGWSIEAQRLSTAIANLAED